MPPKVIQRPDRGVLPVNASARAPKPPAARLKLEIRRLPPGLTLSEFEETLGEEWKLGNGKVDWREYRPGKVKSAAKLPQQSRCYVHLKSEDLVREFEARFLAAVFHDKAGTHKSPELKALPPTLGFAPNQRTPLHAKQRADNRQGTIDQEPEFIAFLEAETQPIAKPSALDPLADKDKEKEVLKSTPLIDDLREKKANKAKAAASKAEKEKEKKEKARSEGKENDKAAKDSTKSSSKKESVPAAKQGGKTSTKQSGKQTEKASEKTAEETKASTPASTKKAQSKTQKSTATPTQPAAATTAAGQSEKSTGSPAPQRQRQRGNNLEGIKKQLHKDLGVKSSSGAKEKGSKDTAQPQTSKAASTEQSATPTPTAPAPATKPANATSSAKESAPASNSTNEANKHRAYLKHANPSQGMTEVLIQQALATYGDLTNVTIDPRKGTAIAVFKDAEGLKKAIEAKKVTVASGAVEVHPFRSERGGGSGGGGGNSGGNRGSRGRGRGGRAGGGGGGGTTNESQGAASGKGATPAS